MSLRVCCWVLLHNVARVPHCHKSEFNTDELPQGSRTGHNKMIIIPLLIPHASFSTLLELHHSWYSSLMIVSARVTFHTLKCRLTPDLCLALFLCSLLAFSSNLLQRDSKVSHCWNLRSCVLADSSFMTAHLFYQGPEVWKDTGPRPIAHQRTTSEFYSLHNLKTSSLQNSFSATLEGWTATSWNKFPYLVFSW